MVHMLPARRIALAPEDFIELFSSFCRCDGAAREISHLASTAPLLRAVLLDCLRTGTKMGFVKQVDISASLARANNQRYASKSLPT
jgi:hypothetical protein